MMEDTNSSSSNSTESQPLFVPQNNINKLKDPNSPVLYQLPSEYPEYKYVLSDDKGIDGGIVLMLTISFLSSISFSIALPSLWSYVQHLGGKIEYLGWATALHSVGTILLSPVLIAWSRRRTMREVLLCSLFVIAAGGVLHGIARNIWMLLAARFIIGAGSSNYVITTVYLAQVGRRTREKALYLNGIVTVVGFALGPGLAACFTPLQLSRNGYELNYFTAPGYFISILAVCAAVFTMATSSSPLRKRARRRRPRPESYDPESTSPVAFHNNSVQSYDIAGSLLNYGFANSGQYYAETGAVDELPTMLRDLWTNRKRLPLGQIIVCILVYFLITLVFTVWETLGTALTQYELHWGVLHNGLMYTGMGVTAAITLLILKGFTKVLAGRLVLPGAIVIMLCGTIVLTATASHWTVPPFITSIALISVGYSGSVSMVIHVYGRVLELSTEVPLSAVGWLATCGSLARVLGPVSAAYLSVYTSTPLWLMLFSTILLSVAAVLVVCTYRRLPP